MVDTAKLFLICAVAVAAASFETTRVTTEWIDQKLDHFNKSDKRTWKMRYFANAGFYIPGGPLFIYVGGHGPVSSYYLKYGLFCDTAKEQNAYLFQTEHRYFGKSRPVEDFTNESLKYLNIQQALADLAHFIRTKKSSSPHLNDAKVILAGNFYSGSLAIWFKKLYPDLANGIWASGAPLLAKLDYKEQTEAVGNRIRILGGGSCYNRIANSFNKMEQMLAENKSTELKTAFNICNSFDANNKLDVTVLFRNLFHAIEMDAKFKESIKFFCEKLMQGSDDFKSFSNFLTYAHGNRGCDNFAYKNELAYAKDITFESPWLYLVCNELGWFSTTSSAQQPFGTKMPLSFFINYCKDLFGDKFTLQYMESQINKTNQLFGGLNPQVENVYITYGQFDSWLPLGIQDVNKTTIIPMESSRSDVKSISEQDSKELKAAKMKFKKLVSDWLN